MKLFLDTNLLIDYYSARKPYVGFFMNLLAMNEFGDAELWASAKSFTDVFYVCKRFVPGESLQRAFSQSSAFLHVCSIGQDDVFEAARRCWPDFEDCIVSIAAEKVKADYLLTRDEKGFARSKVPVVSPMEFFEVLEREYGLVYEEIEWEDED